MMSCLGFFSASSPGTLPSSYTATLHEPTDLSCNQLQLVRELILAIAQPPDSGVNGKPQLHYLRNGMA